MRFYQIAHLPMSLGAEGGTKGGKVMFEGTPKQLLTAKNSLTSEYIRN